MGMGVVNLLLNSNNIFLKSACIVVIFHKNTSNVVKNGFLFCLKNAINHLNIREKLHKRLSLFGTLQPVMKKAFLSIKRIEPRHEKTVFLHIYAKTKTQISFTVTAKLISAFVFALWIVQPLYFLNLKYQVSSLVNEINLSQMTVLECIKFCFK